MARKVYVASVQPDPEGPVFGRVIDPNDIQNLQDYAHGHIDQIVKDLLVAGAPGAQVAGFAAAVAGGLNVAVGAGSVVDAAGLSYEGEATEVTMQAAHVAQPRIDLIYATLAVDAAAGAEFKPFRRLRTQAELEAGTDPYVPTQYNQPTELRTTATIGVKTGVAAAVPAAPVAGAGEVALWQVHVAAGQAVLVNGDLTSVRVLMESLYQLSQRVSLAGLAEIVQDIVGVALAASTSIVPTYDDAGNVISLALHATYKSLLDNATANNTVSTLVKRDSSGDSRFREARVDAGTRYMSDSSFRRSAFVREYFYSLIDLDTPVTFNGAGAGVYQNLTRVAVNSATNFTGAPVVSVAPLFDCYVDPADLEEVSCVFEAYALHTGPNGGTSVWDSDLQLWNATDSVQLAVLNFVWTHTTGVRRSSPFQITGSGLKRLILRARNNTNVEDAYLKIWRVRLIFNPSF